MTPRFVVWNCNNYQFINSLSLAKNTYDTTPLQQHGEPHILRRLQSAEHCILYAAALYFTPDARLHLAAGTVFQGVLLWPVAPAVDGDVPVAARCSGHHGVIFSIAVYNEGRSAFHVHA